MGQATCWCSSEPVDEPGLAAGAVGVGRAGSRLRQRTRPRPQQRPGAASAAGIAGSAPAAAGRDPRHLRMAWQEPGRRGRRGGGLAAGPAHHARPQGLRRCLRLLEDAAATGEAPPGRSPSWWTGCRWWSATSRCTEQRSAGSRMGRSLRPCWRIPTRWMHAAGLLGFLRSNKTSAGSNSSPAATNAVQARLSCSGLLVDTAGTDQRPQIARIHAPWLQTRA
jgi:hypothetical protein